MDNLHKELELMMESATRRGDYMLYSEIVSWWQHLQVSSVAELETILDNFKILFACNSNNIEGNLISYHNTREVFEGGNLSSFNGTARDIFETQNQKFAFDYILRAFENKTEIDLNFILKLHSILLYGCYDDRRWQNGERPGQFKKHEYCVGTDDVGSFPEDVKDDLEELFNEVSEAKEGDVLTKAAYIHAVFETIHPFADGNGRVGRTLLNYYLLQNNHPPLVIYNEDKETYYLALEVFNRTGKLDGFIRFLQEQLVKTWESKITKSKKVYKLNSFV